MARYGQIEVFLSHLSCLGLSPSSILRRAQAAEFDGVELVLFPSVVARWAQYQALAKELDLALHGHQPWSWKENQTHAHNRVLSWLRVLPRDGYRLDDVMPPSMHEPFVAYADRHAEAVRSSNVWLQTCPVFRAGRLAMSYAAFAELVQREHQPIVLDTQHALSWFHGQRGVEGLPDDPELLLADLENILKTLGPYVREVHFNDFKPGRGHTLGRNLWPGAGSLPLKQAARLIRINSLGLGLTLVPEVSPVHLFPYGIARLRALRECVTAFFKEP